MALLVNKLRLQKAPKPAQPGIKLDWLYSFGKVLSPPKQITFNTFVGCP